MKNDKKADFEQHLEHDAPKGWKKYKSTCISRSSGWEILRYIKRANKDPDTMHKKEKLI